MARKLLLGFQVGEQLLEVVALAERVEVSVLLHVAGVLVALRLCTESGVTGRVGMF
jgi:hypothetical protein